jgi:hypothetical protein
MKQASESTDDETVILAWFAHFGDEDGLDGLCRYIMHCGIEMRDRMTAGDAILAHYRNPIGYDIDRAAMDLRTWPPIAARIVELQTAEAERRTAAETKSRGQRRKRSGMNDHAAGHPT